MTPLPIKEIPLVYFTHPRPLLCIDMDASVPTWIICQWCPLHGKFMVDKEVDTWLDPTHFCELPQVPQ